VRSDESFPFLGLHDAEAFDDHVAAELANA